MGVETALVTWLKADADFVAAATGGLHPDMAPQGEVRPHLVYSITEHNFQDSTDAVDESPWPLVTLDYRAQQRAVSRNLARLGREALKRMKGQTIGGYFIQAALVRTQLELPIEAPVDASETTLRRVVQDVRVTY